MDGAVAMDTFYYKGEGVHAERSVFQLRRLPGPRRSAPHAIQDRLVGGGFAVDDTARAAGSAVAPSVAMHADAVSMVLLKTGSLCTGTDVQNLGPYTLTAGG